MYNNSINPYYQLIISFFINPGYWPDKPSFSRNYDYRSINVDIAIIIVTVLIMQVFVTAS